MFAVLSNYLSKTQTRRLDTCGFSNLALASSALAKLALADVALANLALEHIALANLTLANLALASLALANSALANVALANLALAIVVLRHVVSRCWVWETCKGTLEEPAGELSLVVTGEPRGATIWSLHIKNNSKNPAKQKLVREINICIYKTMMKIICDRPRSQKSHPEITVTASLFH